MLPTDGFTLLNILIRRFTIFPMPVPLAQVTQSFRDPGPEFELAIQSWMFFKESARLLVVQVEMEIDEKER